MGDIDSGYVTSCYGILKMLEFVCLMICWICLLDSTGKYRHFRTNFLLGTSIAAWVFVILFFACYLFMLCGNINISNKGLLFAMLHFIWFLLLLISGALVAARAADFYYSVEIYEVAAAFGLISALLFLIDAIYHFKNQNGNQTHASGGTRSVTTTRTVVKTNR